MNPADWDESAVFTEALALPESEREAYLEKACPDPASRDRIRSLLEHHNVATDDFIKISLKPTAAENPAPVELDEFSILHQIGEGGMGVVYLAHDNTLNRKVALKVLARHLIGSEQAIGRFRDEARKAAKLNHPAIVAVHKFGQCAGDSYLVSEFVEGQTLARLIEDARRNKTLSNARSAKAWFRNAAEIAAAIADALDCAHRASIVHRDVKPSNILIDRDRGPRLTDFGVAKELTHQVHSGQTGIIGSCHYMSPEQTRIEGQLIDQRSDIFSLGVVLYEMLTLRLPFDGPTTHHVLKAVDECAPKKLRSIDRRIPSDLETICHKAMEKSPQDRYQSAAQVAADLRSFLTGRPIIARPLPTHRLVGRWVRRKKTAVVAGVMVLLVAALVANYVNTRQIEDSHQGWLRIDSSLTGFAVTCQRQDPKLLRLEREAHDLTASIGTSALLPVGVYRLTARRTSDGALCEYFVALDAPGEQNQKEIRIAAPTDRYPAGAGITQEEPLGRILIAVPRPTDSRDEMIRIPGGPYKLAVKRRRDSVLADPINLDSFLIDKRRVTNREYREFIAATGFRKPNSWASYGYPTGADDLPVNFVTNEEAEAYARWRGKRLPSLHEWQAAARGYELYLYPNGNEPPDIPEPPAQYSADGKSPSGKDHLRFYLERVALVTQPDPLNLPGRPSQTFEGLRELTATVSLPKSDVYLAGRAWCDAVKINDLAKFTTQPFDSPSPLNGFRCAKSLN